MKFADPFIQIAVQPSAKMALVSSGNPSELELWDLTTGKMTKSLGETGINDGCRPFAISADGTRAVTGHMNFRGALRRGSTPELILWDLTTGEVLQRYAHHKHVVIAACLSPDGKRIISASADRTIRIFKTDSPEQIDQIDLGAVNDVPNVLNLSQDGRTLLVGTTRGIALRFELR